MIVLLSPPTADSGPKPSGPYVCLGPTQAVMAFLNANPGKKFRISDVARALRDGGLESKAKAFLTMIGSTLKRLAKDGGLEKEKIDDQPMVFWKKSSRDAVEAASRLK